MSETKNYDAEFCGNLAIHQTNSIQDYGFLMVIANEGLEIIQGSENLEVLTEIPIRELIGTPATSIFQHEDLGRLKAEIAKGNRIRIPFQCLIKVGNILKSLNILLHVRGEQTILEIEQAHGRVERTFTEVFQEVRSFISSIEEISDVDEICRASIHEIRRLTGFDGIRMYRFDREWNGMVIAEEISEELESYLGQTFPASDVPKQARTLYIRNPYRFIPNRDYKTSRLFPVINPISNSFLDLSDCNLRSIAVVHLEYMANMKVMASMSIRVMVDGKLWGLISCHHVTEKYLNAELRSIFEWLSMEISHRISAVVKQRELSLIGELTQSQAIIREHIISGGAIDRAIVEDENKTILSLFNSTGCAIKMGGKISSLGSVPESEDLENLFLWTSGKTVTGIMAIEDLGSIYEEAKAFTAKASGLLIIPIDVEKADYLFCFRPELIRDIKWGGDPNKAINFEPDGKSYHPRNSFKIWLETVRGQAMPWSEAEIKIAESLKEFITGYRLANPYYFQ
ncbi:Phytochrome-like protein cph1 [compost metagenome]